MGIFSGKRFFVYGKGLSGKAAKKAIKKRGGRVSVYSDKCGEFCTPPERGYYSAIISPGIKKEHPVYSYCKTRGIKAMGEIELGFMLTDKPIVGVTGTNGKTTVTRLASKMLGCTACGNIGYPLTAAIDGKSNVLCCELSSFQLSGATNIAPHVAVITNIAPDHIDYHGSFEEYCRCKCNIAAKMSENDYLILGDDVPIGALSSLDTRASIIRCSADKVVDGAYVYRDNFWFMGDRICSVDYLRLQGSHNVKNALCAIAAAKLMCADNKSIVKALSTVASEPHRIEYVGSYCGKRWIDDSKSTNILSTVAAVEYMSGPLCLIVGGRNKGLDFDELFSLLTASGAISKITYFVAMGESASDLTESGKKFGLNVVAVKKLTDAVAAAAESCADTVLLSPACASFDEFNGYGKRGEAFRAAVEALGRKK